MLKAPFPTFTKGLLTRGLTVLSLLAIVAVSTVDATSGQPHPTVLYNAWLLPYPEWLADLDCTRALGTERSSYNDKRRQNTSACKKQISARMLPVALLLLFNPNFNSVSDQLTVLRKSVLFLKFKTKENFL